MRTIFTFLILIGVGFLIYQNIGMQKRITLLEDKIPDSIKIVSIPLTEKGINEEISKHLIKAEVAINEKNLTAAKEEISAAKILASKQGIKNDNTKNSYLEQAKELLKGIIDKDTKK